jgi:hypothetical protein
MWITAAWPGKLIYGRPTKPRHECRGGTQECVRHVLEQGITEQDLRVSVSVM